MNDFSLSELAEEYNVSRQGIHDLLKRCDGILEGYEEKLGLIKRFDALKGTAKSIQGDLESLKEISSKKERNRLISEIQKKITDIEDIWRKISDRWFWSHLKDIYGIWKLNR